MHHAIVLMGPSGIGKGTQAHILNQKFGYHHFMMSRHLKEVPAFKKIIDAGELVPDQGTIDTALAALPSELPRFITFDGIPRSLLQAKWLVDHMSVSDCRICVVEMKVDEDITIQRIVNRAQCAAQSEAPNENAAREDDKNPEAVRNRLNKYYDDYGHTVARYLKKRMVSCGSYYEIDATPEIAEVAKAITAIVHKEHSIMRVSDETPRQFSALTVQVMG